jgi:hypothetical protein
MENKLEQLLNSLIEKGWKPFGKVNRWYVSIDSTIHTKSPFFDFEYHNMSVSTRELIAKESWLWQFVCENELYPPYIQHRRFRDLPTNWLQIHDYRYWVIESALCDEDKLEEFLLSNIKVDVGNRW